MPSRQITLNSLPVPGVLCTAVGVYLLWQQGFLLAWSTLWSILLMWFGVGLIGGGCAFLFEAPSLYCKRPGGTLPLVIWLYMGGWLAIYRTIWLVKQAFCLREKDRMFDRVASRLLMGRLMWELPACSGEPKVDMVVDVTCEWSEPQPLRDVPKYVLFPVVDTTRPTVADTLRIAELVVRHLEDLGAGSVYIHCANGYGRSAIVMAAVLLAGGICDTARDAMEMIVAARPVVSFRHGSKRKKALCETITHSQLLEAIHAELQRRRAHGSSSTSSSDNFDRTLISSSQDCSSDVLLAGSSTDAEEDGQEKSMGEQSALHGYPI